MKRINLGTINVFTYKEGLLSAMAHDLRLTLERFEVEIDPETQTVAGRFWPSSLRIDGAVKEGQLDANGLSERDRRDIHNNITDKVLRTDHHPEVRFRGKLAIDAAIGRIDGVLTLNGQEGPLAVTLRRDAGRYRGEAEFAPSRWGVAPFKALMGAIKLQDRVRLTFDLPDA